MQPIAEHSVVMQLSHLVFSSSIGLDSSHDATRTKYQ